MSPRKRVLIVNGYFDDSHRPLRRPWKVPRTMAPVVLAGALAPGRCEIRLHDEVAQGPLEDAALLGWPDMLVVTGLTNAFDRMRHLAAYARSRNPKVVVVAGGPAVRALPALSAAIFDHACHGDVEELRDVVAFGLGREYAAEEMVPRYDLAPWLGRIGQVETSRYCNFRCAFCALTGEGRRYVGYSTADIRRQVETMGRRRHVLFIDNNLYGNDRPGFLTRLAVIRQLRDEGYYRNWAALVTNDFFQGNDNLTQVEEAGCSLLFSGVESFDTAWLRRVHKLQNVGRAAADLIRECLEAGIVFSYGLMLDVTVRSVADLRRELEFVTGTPDITLPSFLTLPIPLLGTPFFRQCAETGLLLPNTKLRDMDGTTLVLRPRDSLDEVVGFVRDMVALRGYRHRVARHALGFARRYRRRLSPSQMAAALSNAALLSADWLLTGAAGGPPRTHVTTTEPRDRVYRPAFRVAARYESYFEPTMVTDAHGRVTEHCAESPTRALAETR